MNVRPRYVPVDQTFPTTHLPFAERLLDTCEYCGEPCPAGDEECDACLAEMIAEAEFSAEPLLPGGLFRTHRIPQEDDPYS